MVARFFSNALLVVALNLVVKGTYLFGVERTVQNLLPEGRYGLYFSLLGLGMLFQVVADGGIQLFNVRTIAGHRQLLDKYFPYFIGLKLVLGVLFYLLVLAAALLLGYGPGALGLLALAATGQLLNSLVLYLRSNLGGLGRYRLDSFFSILDKLVMIVLVGGLLLFAPGELTVTRFAACQLVSWLLSAVALLAALRPRLTRLRPRFHRPTLLLLLRGGAPYALAVFLMTAYTRTDAIMIERLLPGGAVAVDHYAAGYRLLDALNMLGWLLAGLLMPMFARQFTRGEDLRPLLGASGGALLTVGLAVAVPLAAYAGPVTELLYTFAEPRTARVLFFLALAFLGSCLTYVYGSLLNATGLTGRLNPYFVGAIALNVGGNLWAIPRYGAPGAAAVTAATQALIGLLKAALAHRWLGLAAGVLPWGRLALTALLLVGGAAALRSVAAPWLLEAAALAALGLAPAAGELRRLLRGG